MQSKPYGKSNKSVADPGFSVGGMDLVRWGRGLPRRLRSENFACQNERIGTFMGDVRRVHPPRSANVNVIALFQSFPLGTFANI